MSKNNLHAVTLTSVLSMVSFSFPIHASFAQTAIAPDQTLPNNTVINFNSANQTYTITGGTQVGANQFHSFQDLSVPTANTAHFDNALTTTNVIGRVTGSNISSIDGTLRTNGTTDLYLINPNGIIFGANAKLDIAGSFSASTANSIKFSDGSEFSATNPQAPPLLQVNMPLGLQYGKSNVGATISNSGNLTAGQDLVLNADKLDLQGTLRSGRDLTLQAQDTVQIRDTVITPFFAVAGRDLLVQGNQSVDIFALNHPEQISFMSGGNLALTSDGAISADAHFSSGGDFLVRSLSGQLADLTSLYDPIISSTGNVDIASNYSGASLLIESMGNVRIQGTVTIDSPDIVSFFEGTDTVLSTQPGFIIRSGLTSLLYGINNNPPAFVNNVNIPSGITLEGAVRVVPNVQGGVVQLTAAQGGITFHSINVGSTTGENGGSIALTAQGDIKNTGSFTDNFSILASLSSLGSFSYSTAGDSKDAGNISLTSTFGNIILQEGSISSSSFVYDAKAGNGGEVFLTAFNGNISLTNFILQSDTSSILGNAGNGGTISFSTVNGNISLNNSSSYSRSRPTGNTGNGNTGNGGAISFSTVNGNISLNNSSSDSTSSGRDGNAGNGGAISFSTVNGNISLNNSSSYSGSSSNGNRGNGGVISFSTVNGNISLNNSSSNSTSFSISTFGNAGNGGVISFSTVNGNILLNNSSSDSYSYAPSNNAGNNVGNGGAISFLSNFGNITLNNSSSLNSSSNSDFGNAGQGGDISLFSNFGNIYFFNSKALSYSYSNDSGTAGKGGGISFAAKSGSIISSGSSLLSFAASQDSSKTSGNGGNVTLTAKTEISNLAIFTQSLSAIAGEVNIKGTGDLTLTNLEISTSKSVNIPDPIFPNNPTFITFAPGANGQSGDVTVTGVGNLTFDNTIINSNSAGITPAGNINITSPTTVTFQNNSQIAALSTSIGKAGDINIVAPIVKVNDGSQILAETNGTGAGGNITINASTSVELARTLNAFPILSVQTSNAGKAGNIVVNTPTLTLSDLARITATATATATNPDGGGSITLNASQMNLFGTVGVFAETQGIAPAGTLNLNPYANLDHLNIALAPNSQISASTSNIGRGGDLLITAPQSIYIAGQGKLAVETTGLMDNAGKAGNISFTTSQLTLTDGVLVSASTSGKGTAGDIFVKANNFNITNGARIETATSNSGNSGNIDVRVVDQFNLTGSRTGLFANTLANSSGAGGNIFIDPQSVTLRDGAQIAVGSLGSGIGGNITLISNYLSLLNGSSITAETASTNGGNITLNIPSILLLRYGSQISTTAGTALAGGNGGNINITADFIVGVRGENSDIFANAFTGNGGNVNITTNGIFGLEFRPSLTSLSDITASSQFGIQGNVNVNTPGVDPSKGLNNLPVDIGDPSRLVRQRCIADQRGSEFIITGKGGVPAKPSDRPSNIGALDNFGTLPDRNQTANLTPSPTEPTTTPEAIVEATGWTVNAQNQVVLVAGATPTQPNLNCH